ncbi:RNA polymerase subunit sigma [Diaphorobacter nitroreducens]|uniref:sigma-70 family RNA polymerase sigma factor n=1 Tax=Diaphorobacter nitroreducens TaxID=164759 RepID=UPI000DC7420F|nr:sigma-70 family RNA polymerase sigma factor [Diaphorobacter nitroreducens]ASI68638.1 RNA polymerase subunit sigma [Diaphorobacter nitroreducens]
MSATEHALAQQIHSLYSDHHGWLHGWLRKKLGCAHHAADLAHDTFVRLLVRPRELDSERNPRAYLSTIAHGLVVDHWRRQAIEQAWLETLAVQPEPCAPSAEHCAIVVETLARLAALLDSLPDKPRRAFILAQLHGSTYAEVGAVIGVSERMVKKYMAQAMLHCLTAHPDFT